MTLQEVQNQALQLPISERWHLVQSLLSSIQQETTVPNRSAQSLSEFDKLDPWTQSLIGVIQGYQRKAGRIHTDRSVYQFQTMPFDRLRANGSARSG